MIADKPATKQEVYEIVEEVVGRVVGEIVGDALTLIDNRFVALEKRMNRRFDKLEDKLDTLTARVDHHDIDIRELQRKIA